MSVEQILAAIDTGIAAVLPEIATKQTAFIGTHGRYFQGLPTHSEPPADGQTEPADQLDSHPFYQAETWLDVGYDDTTPHAALAIDQYLGPDGPGYACRFTVLIDGQPWQRVVNVGPATWLAAAWHVLEFPDA